jgi:hypothetical protein
MEDHRTGHRTERLGVLLDQLDFAREIAQARLDGLVSPASLPKGAPLPPRAPVPARPARLSRFNRFRTADYVLRDPTATPCDLLRASNRRLTAMPTSVSPGRSRPSEAKLDGVSTGP